MNKKKLLYSLTDILLLLCLLLVDQYTKYLSVTRLTENKSYVVVDGILELYYLKNTGAAFGILKNQQVLFLLIGFVVLIVVSYLLIKLPLKKKFRICRFFLVMISAGAIGNMIDRIRFDYVIDFIYFSIIRFPVFNVADLFITVSTVGLILLLLFRYKEDDFSFISFKTKKFRDLDNMEQ